MKPIVTFDVDKDFFVVSGLRAQVYALNHPKFGERYVDTSIVLRVESNLEFETLNTIYVPNKPYNQDEGTVYDKEC